MMNNANLRGTIYRCPVCGAEIAVLAPIRGSDFRPHCCNVSMEEAQHRAFFYRCEVCGAEVAAVSGSCKSFSPRCCNQPMVQKTINQ